MATFKSNLFTFLKAESKSKKDAAVLSKWWAPTSLLMALVKKHPEYKAKSTKSITNTLHSLQLDGEINYQAMRRSKYRPEQMYEITLVKKPQAVVQTKKTKSPEVVKTTADNVKATVVDVTKGVFSLQHTQELVQQLISNPTDPVYIMLPVEPLAEAFKVTKRSLNGIGLDCCYNQLFNPRDQKLSEDRKTLIVFNMGVIH